MSCDLDAAWKPAAVAGLNCAPAYRSLANFFRRRNQQVSGGVLSEWVSHTNKADMLGGEGRRAEGTAANATVPQTPASGRHPRHTHPRFSELLLGELPLTKRRCLARSHIPERVCSSFPPRQGWKMRLVASSCTF